MLSKEIKIALSAILALVLLFFGMQFLKGLHFFSTNNNYYIKFNDISGLSASAPVYANGYKVGTIKSIDYDYNNPSDIKVYIELDEGMRIPEGTRAEISSDLLGNVQVSLILGKDQTKLVEKNGVIPGGHNEGSMGKVKEMLPYVESMLPKLDSIMASLNTILASPEIRHSLYNVESTTGSLSLSARNLNSLIVGLNSDIPQITGKANGVMDRVGGLVGNVNGVVGNANHLMTGANTMIGNANTVMTNLAQIDLQATMNKIDATLRNLQSLTEQLNSREGSLGLLMNDNELYNNLNATVKDADSLMIDLRAHPKRYVHFSVFGKKDK
ncbi:MAG: MCE family protein [Prevotella sp.]|jgi:phospholipid/cholesterol/gamma-HCH transport system substrate-binding protein|nr:MCE family protein [Prevotella sp.]